jgi:hypothetical protein
MLVEEYIETLMWCLVRDDIRRRRLKLMILLPVGRNGSMLSLGTARRTDGASLVSSRARKEEMAIRE